MLITGRMWSFFILCCGVSGWFVYRRSPLHTRGQIVMIAYGAEQQKTFTMHRDENVSKQLRASKRKREEEYQHRTMKQSGIHFSSATYSYQIVNNSYQFIQKYSDLHTKLQKFKQLSFASLRPLAFSLNTLILHWTTSGNFTVVNQMYSLLKIKLT